jgi:hypothetical protein
MVFIRLGAAVTRGAPGAALCWEVGAGAHGTRAGPEAALSWEVGIKAAVTRGALGAVLRGSGAVLRREAGAAPRAGPSQSIVGCFW